MTTSSVDRLSSTGVREPAAGLRVCHVIPHLGRVGGYERQAVTLCAAQACDSRIAPLIVTQRSHLRFEVPEGLRQRVHLVPRGLRHFHPRRWWRIDGAGVDIVHAHALHLLCARMVDLARKADIPSILKIPTSRDVALLGPSHGGGDPLAEPETPWTGIARRWVNRYLLGALRQADAVVALNEEIRSELESLGVQASRIERIPNGVDTRSFAPAGPGQRREARRRLDLPEEALVLGFVGRLATRKDVGTLVRAFAGLNSSPPSWLLVLGEGSQRASLESLVAELGVAARVRFPGHGAPHQVLPALDLFVNPSRREGLPNAMLEAWASGLPSVLSDVPGHRDVPGASECALFFTAGDVDTLSAALGRLLGDRALRQELGRRAREEALRAYSIERVEERYRDLYSRLISTRGRRGARGSVRS